MEETLNILKLNVYLIFLKYKVGSSDSMISGRHIGPLATKDTKLKLQSTSISYKI